MGNRTRYFCDQTLDQTENISVHFHAFFDIFGVKTVSKSGTA